MQARAQDIDFQVHLLVGKIVLLLVKLRLMMHKDERLHSYVVVRTICRRNSIYSNLEGTRQFFMDSVGKHINAVASIRHSISACMIKSHLRRI